MAYSTIDVGNGTFDGDGTRANNYTCIDGGNAANATGVLTSFSIWLATSNTDNSLVMGTFYYNGTVGHYRSRDSENNFGNISNASAATFTGRNCDVTSGDFLGEYLVTGTVEASSTGGSGGLGYVAGNAFTGNDTLFDVSAASTQRTAIYATGVTVPDAPTSVSATDNLIDKVTITWTAGTGETDGHKVYRDGTVLNSDTAIAHDTNTFDDTTAAAGTTYAYTVKAINAAGLSAASSADNGIRLSAFRPQILIF
jgi:hypothetical protein